MSMVMDKLVMMNSSTRWSSKFKHLPEDLYVFVSYNDTSTHGNFTRYNYNLQIANIDMFNQITNLYPSFKGKVFLFLKPSLQLLLHLLSY